MPRVAAQCERRRRRGGAPGTGRQLLCFRSKRVAHALRRPLSRRATWRAAKPRAMHLVAKLSTVRPAALWMVHCTVGLSRAASAVQLRAWCRIAQQLSTWALLVGASAEASSRAAPAGHPADPADGAGGAGGAAGGAGEGEGSGAARALPKEVSQPRWLLAFNLFASERRRELRAESETRSGTDAERLIGNQWRSMTDVRARAAALLRAHRMGSTSRQPHAHGARIGAHACPHRRCRRRSKKRCTCSAPRRSGRASWPHSSVRLAAPLAPAPPRVADGVSRRACQAGWSPHGRRARSGARRRWRRAARARSHLMRRPVRPSRAPRSAAGRPRRPTWPARAACPTCSPTWRRTTPQWAPRPLARWWARAWTAWWTAPSTSATSSPCASAPARRRACRDARCARPALSKLTGAVVDFCRARSSCAPLCSARRCALVARCVTCAQRPCLRR